MILHTIVPQELVFGMEDTERKEYMASINGVPVMCEPINGFEVRITKLLSTDPNHYLNPSIFPGAILSLGKGS